METQLPSQFQDLQRFVARWALPTEKDRFHQRIASPLAEVRTFNDAMHARIHEVISYLDAFALDSREPQVLALMSLARSYMETSHPVDLGWQTTDLADAFPSDRFTFVSPSC
jgi:hypothetical protein